MCGRRKASRGGPGADGQTIEGFESNLKGNLYRIWNRMSSGSYFPPPVKLVVMLKSDGSERRLGVPTVSDRVAQNVVKMVLEPIVEPQFHADSYGDRPGHDALAQTRARCWRRDWVLDLDIRAFFDTLDHALVLRDTYRKAMEAERRSVDELGTNGLGPLYHCTARVARLRSVRGGPPQFGQRSTSSGNTLSNSFAHGM